MPDWYYLYRWGVSPCHLSGVPDMQGLYDSLGTAPAAAGRFTLSPHWRQDYPALAASAARQWRAVSRGPKTATSTPASQHGSGEPAATPPTNAGRPISPRSAASKTGAAVPPISSDSCRADCYWGIDLDPSVSADHTADLATYTSTADGLFMRHVLEHDLRWRSLLRNALASFRRRMVLVLHTPFVRATEEHHRARGRAEGTLQPEIRFCRADLCASSVKCGSASKKMCRPIRRSAASTSSTFARTDRHERVPRPSRHWQRRHPAVRGDSMTPVHPELAAAYHRACATPGDIYLHLPTLYRYASCCRHVTEFGTRTGVSTLALLRALPGA